MEVEVEVAHKMGLTKISETIQDILFYKALLLVPGPGIFES